MFPELTSYLVGTIAILALGVLVLMFRQRVLFRIGTRNIRRRKVNTLLVILGAMLGTMIITTAMVTGDTLDYSIKRTVYEQMGQADLEIRRLLDGGGRGGDEFTAGLFDDSLVERIAPLVLADPNVEAILPNLMVSVPLIHIDPASGETILAEPAGRLIGVDVAALCSFEKKPTAECPSLSDSEAIITPDLQTALDLAIGDTIVINYQNNTYPFQVAAVVADTGLWQVAMGPMQSLNVFVTLPAAQAIVTTPVDSPTLIPPEAIAYLGQLPEGAAILALLENPPKSVDEIPAEVLATLASFGIDLAELLGAQNLIQSALPAKPINGILVSNVGGVQDGVQKSDAVIAAMEPQLEALDRTDVTLQIVPIKQNELSDATQAGEGITTMFLVLGGFSALAGTLLIINIFVMLAAERKSEMGIMRAIGLKRRHLVATFVLEGSVYAVIASLLGVIAGLALAYLVIAILEYLFNNISFFEGDFNLQFVFRWPSLINAFAVGLLITLVSVVGTSWQISKINIVHAIRDILAFPPKQFSKKGVVFAILLLLAGGAMTVGGFGADPHNATLALLGPCFVALGVALLIRIKLSDQLVFTAWSLGVLLYSLLGHLVIDGYFDSEVVFILVGLLAVFSTVLIAVFNDRLLLWPLQQTLGRIPRLRALIKMIVTYPLSSRFRTGMTLSMYSLIIFMVIIISILKTVQQVAIKDAIDEQTRGYDLQITYNAQNPISDLAAEIEAAPQLDRADFTHILALSYLSAEVDPEAYPNLVPQEDIPLQITGIGSEYLERAGPALNSRATGYESDEAVWAALVQDPTLVVIDSSLGKPNAGPPVAFPKVAVGDELHLCATMASDVCSVRTIVGTISGSGLDLFASLSGLEQDFGVSRQNLFTSYQLDLAEGVDKAQLTIDLEKAFVANGLQVLDMESLIKEVLSLVNTFFTLMQGFLGMGLVAGIAGLSIIMMRSVHERRQQIGVLRAIGFRRSQILLSFLGETSFIALLGIAIGFSLGTVIAYFIFQEQVQEVAANATFAIPWGEVLIIIGIAYVFSLLGTIWPSRKAAALAPAEVLRYQG